MDIIASTTPTAATPSSIQWLIPLGTPMFVIAALFGIAARVSFARDLPLWFDETFTAVIATQPNVTALVRWCLTELSGPAFYMPMWLWAQVAGASDTALRLPGLAMSIAAPLILAWRGHPDRGIRRLWATLAFLSTPMIIVANEARPYSQLFLFGCLQAIAFLAVMRGPTTHKALAWTSVTTVLILTHYHTVTIAALQGLTLLAVHRRVAIRCWPALLAFVPAGIWIGCHLAYVLAYAGSMAAAFAPQHWQLVAMTPLYLLGTDPLLGLVILFTVIGSTIIALRSAASRLHYPLAMPDGALIVTGLVTLAIVMAMAFIRPGFATRYLTPALPALLFALATWVKLMLPRYPVAVALATLSFVVGVPVLLSSNMYDSQYAARRVLSFGAASQWMLERHPRRLIFAWQSPDGLSSSTRNLQELTNFFFKRAGHPVAVTIVRPTRSDLNPVVEDAAAGGATAILWLRDFSSFTGSAPAIAIRYQGWQCRNFGSSKIVVYACRQSQRAAPLLAR